MRPLLLPRAQVVSAPDLLSEFLLAGCQVLWAVLAASVGPLAFSRNLQTGNWGLATIRVIPRISPDPSLNMKIAPLGLLLSFCGTAAAQCEITRIVPPTGLSFIGDFRASQISVIDGTGVAQDYEALNGAWVPTNSYTPPGAGGFFFSSPRVVHKGTSHLFSREEDGELQGRAFLLDGTGAITTFAPSNPTGLDAFGSGIAMEEGLIVIGASQAIYDVGSCGPGKCYIYEETPSGWAEVATFVPHNYGSVVTDYGYQLDTDGNTIVFGAPRDDGAGKYAGAAYVYQRNNTTGWFEAAKLIASDAKPGFFFGSDVTVDGNHILVGAENAGPLGNGAVYAFERQGNVWVETQIIRASNGQHGDAFGAGIDMDGTHAAVGATGVDGAFQNCGALYLLERDASGWFESARLVANDVTGQNFQYGENVRVSGNQVLWAPRWGGSVRLYSLGIENATSYCTSSPNSSGSAALMSVDGCDSMIANALTLRAMGVPANKPGLFFYGALAAQLPAGNGTLCIASPQRLTAELSDSGGVLETNVDFQSPEAQAVTPGATWRFQAFFRDTVGAGFDFSDGIELELQF
jgi:hypothetical protein